MPLNPLDWAGEEGIVGVQKKPDKCKLCPNYILGNGFVEDEAGENAKVLILLPKPSKNDILNHMPLSEGMARWWDFRVGRVLECSRNEFSFAHVLRCQRDGYPTGKDRKKCEESCRTYDDKMIKKFNPNLYIVTFSPQDIIETQAFYRLFLRSLEKAFIFAAAGDRPMVLCGQEAFDLFLPGRTGGVKSWQGHWWMRREING